MTALMTVEMMVLKMVELKVARMVLMLVEMTV